MAAPSPPLEPHKGPGFFRAHYGRIAVVFVFIIGAILVLCISRYSSGSHYSREGWEIAAMSAALESYKYDHGKYPSDPRATEQLKPNSSFDPLSYITSSEFLYSVLSGNSNSQEPHTKDSKPNTVYMSFSPNMLKTSPNGRIYIVDPLGNSYGYSTFKAAHPESKEGNNPTFDLWSTHGNKSGDQSVWYTNW
jgi:hypothetical protein